MRWRVGLLSGWEANYSSDLTQTTGDTFGYGSLHHLTLNRAPPKAGRWWATTARSPICAAISAAAAPPPSRRRTSSPPSGIIWTCGPPSWPGEPRCPGSLHRSPAGGCTGSGGDRRGRIRRHLRCTVPPRLLCPHAAERRDGAGDPSGDPTGGSPTAGRHRRTRTSVDHTLTLRQQTDGSWQVCGDSYEALGHTCAVTP